MEPILKYPGAKWSLSKWVISNLPEHDVYLEPYFGSGAVFFNKQPCKIETINDIDGNVINLFKVIRERAEELSKLIEFTPWSRDEYYKSYDKTGDNLEDARRFLVRCWQAFGTRTCAKTGWRHSAAKTGPSIAHQWMRVPETIKEVAERLKYAQIENMAAIDLIKKYNSKEVLIYADPPYLLSTRSGKAYEHEMNDQEHMELLEALVNHPGQVVLSGYDNEMYDKDLNDWIKISKRSIAELGTARTEVLWIKE